MDSFDNMLKAACHIKSYHLNQDKKLFEKLPDFYKVGLYCHDMFKNVRNQSFFVKIAAYEVQKNLALELVRQKDFDEAEYSFCKCLSIFKYIRTRSKNWKNEGIKDEDLEYFEDKGNNEEENKLIGSFIISSLLNIAFCNLEMQKYDECRDACNEVLKRDPKNIKAYYRRARTYMEYKASCLEDHFLALKDFQTILTIEPNNAEIRKTFDELNSFVQKEKQGERKVFKSFFRKIRQTEPYNDAIKTKDEYEKSAEEKIEKDKFTKVLDEDNNIGKPEIRILNLLIEQCYVLRDRYERENNRIEMKKIDSIAEKAKEYRSELQKLLELNFDNPNDELKEFAEKNKMDLKDSKIKKHFLDIRKKYLEDINKFYENNFLNFNQMNPNPLRKNTQKSKKIIKDNITEKVDYKKSFYLDKNLSKNEIGENSVGKNREFLKQKIQNDSSILEYLKNSISLPIFFSVLLFALVLMYLKNKNELE